MESNYETLNRLPGYYKIPGYFCLREDRLLVIVVVVVRWKQDTNGKNPGKNQKKNPVGWTGEGKR